MADVEANLRSTVQPVLLPGEEVLGVSCAPEEPSRWWHLAIGIGFILGILPGLIVGLVLLAKYLDPPFIVATNRRLFLFKGRVKRGFVYGRRVVDLGTVGGVEEKPNGNLKGLALNFRGGGKLGFTNVSRDAKRGLSAATMAGFFDGFAGWLSGNLPQLQAQAPLTKAQLVPPHSRAVKMMKIANWVAVGLVVLMGLGYGFKIVVLDRMARADESDAQRARMDEVELSMSSQRVATWRALGATEEAKQWLAALAAGPAFSSPFIGLSIVPPPGTETAAVEQAARATARSSDQVGSFASATGMYTLGFSGPESIQHRFSRLLGADLSEPPLRVQISPYGDGRVRVDLHVRPAAGGRVHRYDRTYVCPLFDTTATITATATGGPTLTRTVEVPAPTDETLRSDYWQRFPMVTRCIEAQMSEVESVVTREIGDLFVGPGAGAQL